jgi:hypothetical protein
LNNFWGGSSLTITLSSAGSSRLLLLQKHSSEISGKAKKFPIVATDFSGIRTLERKLGEFLKQRSPRICCARLAARVPIFIDFL